jgi:hypothetical protein
MHASPQTFSWPVLAAAVLTALIIGGLILYKSLFG